MSFIILIETARKNRQNPKEFCEINTRNEFQSQGRGSIKQSCIKENECIERGVRTMEVSPVQRLSNTGMLRSQLHFHENAKI